MTPPLRLSLEIACSTEHAFSVWTNAIGSWWPPDHTVSGRPEEVVLQGGVGGRIFERTADGVEHDWGEVTVWDPPTTLAYLWHIGRDRSAATEVEIQFLPDGADATRIEIEHRGWERLGKDAQSWRERNEFGWQTLLPHFQAAVTRGDS
jgi:hypothetical protein